MWQLAHCDYAAIVNRQTDTRTHRQAQTHRSSICRGRRKRIKHYAMHDIKFPNKNWTFAELNWFCDANFKQAACRGRRRKHMHCWNAFSSSSSYSCNSTQPERQTAFVPDADLSPHHRYTTDRVSIELGIWSLGDNTVYRRNIKSMEQLNVL